MKCLWLLFAVIGLALFPHDTFAQGVPEHIRGLHKILDDLYIKMMPRCAELIGYARAIAAFAAIFYIGHRVWKHIANAEPIDFYPLFRPFVLGGCILLFPQIIQLMNAILKPTVVGTQALMDSSTKSVKDLLAKKEAEMKKTTKYLMYGSNDGAGDRDLWLEYTYPDEIGEEGLFGSVGNDLEFAMSKAYYNFKSWFKEFIAFVLQLLYEAAALCVNTIRTFNLIICAMLGPFVFALACFDGFQHTLTVYLARYVNFYLWLPVCNILGAILGMIQEGMIQLDIQQIQTYGDSFFSSSDIGYLIFMLIGIVSYFTVPNVANMIVNAGGGSALTARVSYYATRMLGGSGQMVLAGASGVVFGGAAAAGMAADALGDANLMATKGYAGHGAASGYHRDKLNG